jgi:hypothetical protein
MTRVMRCHSQGGRISGMYYVRDPAKLSRIGAEILPARR